MQRRFFEYQAPINSLDWGTHRAAVIEPGVYRGFDSVVGSGLQITINHSTTGYRFPNALGTILGNPSGVWITKQGVTIIEDEPIVLDVISNVGNPSARIDLIVGRHVHDTITVGGLDASYEVIKGPNNSTAEPTITNAENAVVVGKIIIPAGDSNTTGVTFVKATNFGLGGILPAQLNKLNRFVQQQQLNEGASIPIRLISVPTTSPTGTSRGVIEDGQLVGGNTFRIGGQAFLDLLPDRPVGTEITLYINSTSAITIRPAAQNTWADGTRPYTDTLRYIPIDTGSNSNLVVDAYQPIQLVRVDAAGSFNVANPTEFRYGRLWKVISVGPPLGAAVSALNTSQASQDASIQQLQAANTQLTGDLNTLLTITIPELASRLGFRSRSVILADITNPTNFFDATGLGIVSKEWEGWAICNGNNGTIDRRGTVPIGRDEVINGNYVSTDTTLRTIGNRLGDFFKTLTGTNLPPHSHLINFGRFSKRGNGDSQNIGTIVRIQDNGPRDNGDDIFSQTASTAPETRSTEAFSIIQPSVVSLYVMKL